VTEFERAWAVVSRDLTPIDGEEADVVDVLKVFRTKEDALAEVKRPTATEGSDDRFFYCEATELEQQ
jgi:hypothetical protein